ncbi:MAG TPA: ABC transporter permease [bacterium]|nr:ABC transporter permease [bacterium]
MLVTDIFRLATRMFRTNTSRTLLTILGISVGIGAILFLLSLGYGLQNLILNQITTSDALLSLDVTAGEIENLKLNDDSLKQIKETIGVEKVSQLISAQGQMKVGDISTELLVNFANQDFFKLDGTTIKKGDFYTDEEGDNSKIIISSSALQLFNLSEEDAFEKTIKFTILVPILENSNETKSVELDNEFKIVGIIQEEGSNYAYMPLSWGNQLGIKDYNKIKVKVRSEGDLTIARSAIMEKGYSVSALSDIIEQAKQVFNIVQIVLASFGVVALIVSAIGMFNTMTIALLERTQEIGIMKALGATSGDVWQMFLAEAVIIGFLGGLGGIIIGWAGGQGFNYGINLLAGAFGGDKIDIFYTPFWFVTLIISFSTIVGLLTGFYPARRAAKISPLVALRYK